MSEEKVIRKKINQVSRETGIPVKKVLDLLFILRLGEPAENNTLLRRVGVAKNTINQVKELLSPILKPPSKNTQLDGKALQEVQSLFGPDYKPEEVLWSFLENDHYQKTIELLRKYSDQRPSPERKYDQFTATIETTARRASLLNFFEDLRGKKLLFLGDDDFTSVTVASLHLASEVTALDIDDRILDKIGLISKSEGLGINLDHYDARRPLPSRYSGKFDVVFTDPPYTTNGIKLFISRAISALDPSNQAARIYLCYGNSDKAKERFLPIFEIFVASGLMVRWVFDKFNRYEGAESIGNVSSLYVCDVTSKTKSLVKGESSEKIYTNL